MTDETTIINKTERPNSVSFRVGGAGSPEFKVYFDTAEDLLVQINALKSLPIEQEINILKSKHNPVVEEKK